MLRGNLAPRGAVLKVSASPIPARLLRAGVRDMVRISDARMSGTAYGTCVLHVTPEAAVGGPLGLVRDGALVRLDVAAGRLDVLLGDDGLADRRLGLSAPTQPPIRGYQALSGMCSRPTRAATSTSCVTDSRRPDNAAD